MIGAFHDYKRSTPQSGGVDQWHLVLDPLHQQFQRWKAGEISHLEINEAIDKTHKGCRTLTACLRPSEIPGQCHPIIKESYFYFTIHTIEIEKGSAAKMFLSSRYGAPATRRMLLRPPPWGGNEAYQCRFSCLDGSGS